MKQISIILFASLLAIMSCKKDETIITDSSNENNNNNNTVDPNVLWEYKIASYDARLTDIVMDDNDNIYYFARANDLYTLYSIKKDGTFNWSKDVPFGSYYGSKIMIAGDKLILSYQWDVIACFNTTDGTQLWSTNINVDFSDMAYSNNSIYVALSSVFQETTSILSINANTGAVNWEKIIDRNVSAKISVSGTNICLVSQDQTPWPYLISITMFVDNGTAAVEMWSDSKSYDPNDNAATPQRASFDGLGNVYYEEGITDSTYIRSYIVASGNVNWEQKLCNYGLPNPVILYGNGTVIASYKSDDSWGIVNSTMVLNATTGAVIKQNDNIILNDSQILMTGDYTTVVFNRLVNDSPTMQIYNSNGVLSSSTNIEYLGWFVTSLEDCRINSDGHLVVSMGEYIKCINTNLAPPNSGTWNCRKANNKNTNSI